MIRTVTGFLLLLLAGCAAAPPPPPAPPTFAPTAVADRPGLHNVFRLNDRLYSGSGPEGDEGFRSLSLLGIRTVLSVDGATPDVAAAERHGLRYVHLPIGYDGVPRETALRIAKAVQDLPGPVYLHCHHGKHRGPAAAAAAVRCLDDRCTAAAALEFLHAAGTDPNYKGLIADVERIQPATPAELAATCTEFPTMAPVPDLVRAMVSIDDRWEHVKAIRGAGWKPPLQRPDFDPPHEALQLREHFREAARTATTAAWTDEFRKMLTESEAAAARLEELLRTAERTSGLLESAFRDVSAGCVRCHRAYRDAPR